MVIVKGFKIFRFAFVVLTVAAVWLAPTISRAADVDDLSDAHALGPYDEVACNGAFEDELDTGDPANSFFPPFEFSAEDNSDDSGGTFSGAYVFPFSDEEVKQKFNRDSEQSSEPTVTVQVAPTEVLVGEEVAVIGTAGDFRDTNLSQNQAIGMTFAVDDVSLQGIQAGGRTLPEGGSPCGNMSRTPATDADGDGMDDTWESVHGLNPGDPGDAFADPDGDSAFQFYTNADGETLIISPGTDGGDPGAMSNLAEYIWDTDPRNPDTDKDQIPDGQEILGFGGPTVSWINDRPIGSTLEFRVYAVGVSIMTDAMREREQIVKLDSSTKTVFVGNGEHLQGRIETEEDFTEPGETTVLAARFVGTEAEPDSFAYTYIVDGQEVENSSTGRHQLEVPVESTRQPGEQIPYEIKAVNPNTGQQANLRGVIRVGEKITLQSEPTEPVAAGPLTVHATLPSGTDPDEYLFEWRIDGQLDESASGVGKDAITLIAPTSTGATLAFDVQLFAVDDSQAMGREQMEVSVAKPEVEISLVPAEPVAGDNVTAIAKPKNFPFNLDTDQDGIDDASSLSYQWVIDGVTLAPDENAAGLSTAGFGAGAAGDSHQVSVSVSTTAGRSQNARAEVSFETKPDGTVAAGGPIRRNTRVLLAQTLAGLPSAARLAAFGTLLAVGLLSSALWMTHRNGTKINSSGRSS